MKDMTRDEAIKRQAAEKTLRQAAKAHVAEFQAKFQAKAQAAKFQAALRGEAALPGTEKPIPVPDLHPGYGSASVQTPNGVFLFTPRQHQVAQAMGNRCRALLAWYEEFAEAAEREQQELADTYSHWQQGRGTADPRQQAYSSVRPLPIRAGKRTPLGRACQHWNTPAGRFLVQVRLCETVLLPQMRAHNTEERTEVNALLASGLGLADAVAAGLLTGYTVCWQETGRWPRRPVSVHLFWPGGKLHGARLLGKHRSILTYLQAKVQVHSNEAW